MPQTGKELATAVILALFSWNNKDWQKPLETDSFHPALKKFALEIVKCKGWEDTGGYFRQNHSLLPKKNSHAAL